MQMEYFNEFVELARIGNYTTASQVLNISQSVLSKHIKIMESELDVQLFVRSKRGVELSKYGLLLLPYANQIMNINESYMKDIATVKNNGSTLKIASVPAVKQMGIGELIAGFVKENPNVSINILENESAYLVDCLQKQECDLAFVRGIDSRYSELNRLPYVKDRLIALLPVSHPLAQKKELTLKDFKHENLIFSAINTKMYNIVYDACCDEGFEPNIVYTNNNGRHSVEMIERNVGIALMNERVGRGWIMRYKDLCGRDIVPHIETTVYVYYHPKHITPMAEAFLNYVIDKKRLRGIRKV